MNTCTPTKLSIKKIVHIREMHWFLFNKGYGDLTHKSSSYSFHKSISTPPKRYAAQNSHGKVRNTAISLYPVDFFHKKLSSLYLDIWCIPEVFICRSEFHYSESNFMMFEPSEFKPLPCLLKMFAQKLVSGYIFLPISKTFSILKRAKSGYDFIHWSKSGKFLSTQVKEILVIAHCMWQSPAKFTHSGCASIWVWIEGGHR